MREKQNPLKRLMSINGMASVLTAFVGVVILMIVFSIMNPNFIKFDSVMNLLRSIVPFLLVGIGQGYVCITGNIDLSIGSVLAMSAMISATMVCNGFSVLVAVLVAFVCCMLVGLINGVLVGKFELPPFIATLGTMTIARGVAQLANGNYNTDNIGSTGAAQVFKDVLYYGKTLGVYNGVWIAIIVWAVFFFVLTFTRSGRHIYAVGSNRPPVRRQCLRNHHKGVHGFCVLLLPHRPDHHGTVRYGRHERRHELRDVRCRGGGHRRHFHPWRQRPAGRRYRGRLRVGDPAVRPDLRACAGCLPQYRHRYHRRGLRHARRPAPQG